MKISDSALRRLLALLVHRHQRSERFYRLPQSQSVHWIPFRKLSKKRPRTNANWAVGIGTFDSVRIPPSSLFLLTLSRLWCSKDLHDL